MRLSVVGSVNRNMKRVIVCLMVLVAAQPAFADNPTAGISVDASQLGSAHPHAAATATRVEARAPRMPAVLAGSADPARRAELERSYTQVLAAYEQTLDKARLARNDVAVAAAMYISGAYGAYRGTRVSDAAFSSLVTQLRDALAATASFANAPIDRKQDMYEGLAITGALLAASVQSNPGNAAVRSAGKTALEGFLHTTADSIQITDRGMSVAGGAARSDAPAPAAPSPRPAASPSPAPSQDLAPTGKPFPSSSVAALLWSFELRYEAFPANSMVNVESDYLLLADGSCVRGIPRTLDGFDPATERAAHPNSKCRWRKDNNSYTVSTGGPFNALPHLTVLRAAKRGERLAGTWSRSRTTTVGTATTWKGTTLVLGEDGRFELSSAGAWQTGSDVNRPQGEVTISGSYDNKGSRATISGDHAGGSMQTRTGNTAADQSGTYVLDGFSVELHYDSGRVERQMFAISTDGKHVFVRLGGVILPKK